MLALKQRLTPLLKNQWLKNSLTAVADLIFPPTCSNCSSDLESRLLISGEETGNEQHQTSPVVAASMLVEVENRKSYVGQNSLLNLCRECFDKIMPTYSHRCKACGAGQQILTTDSTTNQKLIWLDRCAYCRRTNFHFDQCFALGNYELAMREAVLRIKSGAHDALILDLAKMMIHEEAGLSGVDLAGVDSVGADLARADLVVPIPIHWRRRWARRTVVAENLAEHLSRLIGVPLFRRALRYGRLTAKQGTLSTTDRIENVKGSLRVTRQDLFHEKRVLIVDDVMTSGATLNEAASVCLEAGAHSVSVAVVARGIGRSMNR